MKKMSPSDAHILRMVGYRKDIEQSCKLSGGFIMGSESYILQSVAYAEECLEEILNDEYLKKYVLSVEVEERDNEMIYAVFCKKHWEKAYEFLRTCDAFDAAYMVKEYFFPESFSNDKK